MKESYECEVATHIGPESCGAAREGGVEALTRECAGRVFSRVRNSLRDADAVGESGRPHPVHRYREVQRSPARSQTPCRTDTPSALERVRQAASKDKEMRFTAFLHHIYNLETLRTAYFCLKKEAAPGADGETWRHYGETLEDNLQDLSHRLQ